MPENNQLNTWESENLQSNNIDIENDISKYYSDLVEQLLEERKKNI